MWYVCMVYISLSKYNSYYTERTILLTYLKTQLDTDLKIILLGCKNKYRTLKHNTQYYRRFWYSKNQFKRPT